MHADSLRVHGKGGDLYVTAYRNSVAKVIANRALCAPTAGKGLAYFFNTLRRVQDPGARLPRRLMAQVLGVATGKLGHPVTFFILMEAGDRRIPFVRVVFAFARLLR
ncbi:transposase [Pseudomonas sp. IT-P260]